MKIAILTHPLINNYGGILQALALKAVLEKIGHSVIIFDRKPNMPICKVIAKRLIQPFYSIIKGKNNQLSHHKEFISKNFKLSSPIFSHNKLIKSIRRYKIDAVVIGSDQVWNHEFSKRRDFDYWGNFDNSNVITMSYAASMGIPLWEYGEQSTKKIVNNLRKFTGISVREFHMIPLLENIGIQKIEWVLDPTLLLNSEFYSKFASDKINDNKPFVFIYWMGDEKLIPDIPKEYSHFKIIKCNLSDINNNLSMGNWLAYMQKAELIITNSFHGCALSIINKKHFIPYINKNYVESRLISLFTMLNLKEKLTDPYSIEDYKLVEIALNYYQKKSISFINQSLSTTK